METDATFSRPARVVVLNAEASKDLHLAIVHAHGDAKVVFAYRHAQQVAGWTVEAERLSRTVKLSLGNLKDVESLFVHSMSFFFWYG
jgi:hypothetical protein